MGRVPPGGDLLLWQLADSAFPTGAFAHSAGLEAAWRMGLLRDPAALAIWIAQAVDHVGAGALPLALAAHRDPGLLPRLDTWCDATTTAPSANRASRGQGRSLLTAAAAAFGGGIEALRAGYAQDGAPCHLAPVWGVCLRLLEVPRETAGRLLLFAHCRSLVSAAIRLNRIGPLAAQGMQARLAQAIEDAWRRHRRRSWRASAQTAPLIELAQAHHDRLDARLFAS